MAVSLETDSFETEEVANGGSGGGGTAAPGWYHLKLVQAEEGTTPNTNSPYCQLKFEVMSPGSELGKTCRETLWYPTGEDADKDKTKMKRIYVFAFALGVITVAEYEAARAAGQQVNIDFESGIDCQAVAHWHQNGDKTHTDSKGREWPDMQIYWSIFSFTHKSAKNAVIDWDVAATEGVSQEACEKAWGSKSPAGSSAGYSTKAGGTAPAAGKATATAKSTYADI